MARVRYAADGGRYRVGGTTFEPGDEADVAAGLADHLVEAVGAFEYVESSEGSEEGPTAGADDIADPPIDPTAHSVAELETHLADAEYGAAELRALASAEATSKDRTTALDAIASAAPDGVEIDVEG